jgi:SAM-dependent methyltransferase
MFVRLKDRMRLFRTETRDFTDAELLSIKEDTGQIYLDVSKKLAPDDFAHDLKKLVPSAECRACPDRPRCAGAWEPVAGDVFGRDDERVLEILRGLEGRVLDIGAGEGPYLRVLAPAIREGRVRWIAVDPDEARLRLLASRAEIEGKCELVVARAEDLPDNVGPVDHVLFLRSFNHLADPTRAVARALSLLRPGGTVLAVDNVAFGLVRDRAVARRAETFGGATFEHTRNDDAGRAAARLEGLPLKLLERRDVGPDTSNQWLLRWEVSA